jgi:hypothetical protein
MKKTHLLTLLSLLTITPVLHARDISPNFKDQISRKLEVIKSLQASGASQDIGRVQKEIQDLQAQEKELLSSRDKEIEQKLKLEKRVSNLENEMKRFINKKSSFFSSSITEEDQAVLKADQEILKSLKNKINSKDVYIRGYNSLLGEDQEAGIELMKKAQAAEAYKDKQDEIQRKTEKLQKLKEYKTDLKDKLSQEIKSIKDLKREPSESELFYIGDLQDKVKLTDSRINHYAKEIIRLKGSRVEVSPESREVQLLQEMMDIICLSEPDPLKEVASLERIDPVCKAPFYEVSNEDLAPSKKAMEAFVKLQRDLTLNRLAWAYLKNLQKLGSPGSEKKVESIQKVINDLLLQKDQSSKVDPEFKKASAAFHGSQLSRKTLADVFPYLANIFVEQNLYDDKTQPYKLGDADVKMTALLAESEKSDLLLKNKSKPESVMNLLKMIDSSYRLGIKGEDALSTPGQVSKNISLLEEEMKKLQTKINKIVVMISCRDEKGNAPNEKEIELCSMNEKGELEAINSKIQSIFEKMMEDSSLKGSAIEKLRYGEFWLKVKSP